VVQLAGNLEIRDEYRVDPRYEAENKKQHPDDKNRAIGLSFGE